MIGISYKDSKSYKVLSLLKEYNELPEYIGMKLSSIHQKSEFGDYPIHIASVRGSIDELRLLLANGADVNAVGEHGYTPLHNAVEQGFFDVVAFLLAQGADVLIENDHHLTAKALAKIIDNDEIYQKIDDFEKENYH